MDWISMDLLNERTGWMLVAALFGWIQGALSVYWICLRPAKLEHRQLKDRALVKVKSIGAKLDESEELLDRLSKDYPHLFQDRYGTPTKPTAPHKRSRQRTFNY